MGTEPVDGGSSWHGKYIAIDLGVALVGLVVTVAVWTSRLVLAGGVLTATNFGISRSMRLVEVADVDPSVFPFLGMRIRRHDRSGIRTLVSGQAWNEPWTPRAAKIAREVEELAERERSCSVSDEQPPTTVVGTWAGERTIRLAAAYVLLGALIVALLMSLVT